MSPIIQIEQWGFNGASHEFAKLDLSRPTSANEFGFVELGIVTLPPTPAKLLTTLMQHPQLFLSRDELMDSLYGKNLEPALDRAIDGKVKIIRERLTALDAKHLLCSRKRVGYCFAAGQLPLPPAQEVVYFGAIRLHKDRLQGWYNNQIMVLPRGQLMILRALLAAPERVQTHANLANLFGLEDSPENRRLIASTIKNLRHQLPTYGIRREAIESVYDTGYAIYP